MVTKGDGGNSLVAQLVKNLPAMAIWETWVQSLGWEDPPRGGHGNPLQYSCLENPRDRGAWWAAVSGVTQSRTRLKRLSSSSSSIPLPSPTLALIMHWKRL